MTSADMRFHDVSDRQMTEKRKGQMVDVLQRQTIFVVPQLLVVGSLLDWSNAGHDVPKGDGISFLDFSNFDGPALLEISPDIVVSGLFGPTFDALDIATILQTLRYRGRYRVIADRIPKPGLVRSEVRLVAPDIDFDILNLQAEMAELC